MEKKWDKKDFEKLSHLQQKPKSSFDSLNKDRTAQGLLPVEHVTAKSSLYQTHRDAPLHLDAQVNKIQIISASNLKQAGFHCELCDFSAKDNLTFLDHMNSIRHQRASGKGFRVERASIEEVRERLEFHRSNIGVVQRIDVEKQIAEAEDGDKLRKAEKKALKKMEKKQDLDFGDDSVAEMMGFSSFGSSNK